MSKRVRVCMASFALFFLQGCFKEPSVPPFVFTLWGSYLMDDVVACDGGYIADLIFGEDVLAERRLVAQDDIVSFSQRRMRGFQRHYVGMEIALDTECLAADGEVLGRASYRGTLARLNSADLTVRGSPYRDECVPPTMSEGVIVCVFSNGFDFSPRP